MIYIGIDPGLTGAIAAITEDGIELFDMPITRDKTLDYRKLSLILKQLSMCGDCTAYIEKVGSRTGQGVTSMFTFGMVYGAAITAVAAAGVPLRYVLPQQWKASFGLIGSGKDSSRLTCLKLYPELQSQLHLKKHHGRGDALLIARYGLEFSRATSNALVA